MLLVSRLDSIRMPRGAYSSHRDLRRFPEFDQEPGGNHAGAPNASSAVDEDVGTVIELLSKAYAVRKPRFVEVRSRRAYVWDRKVEPFHIAAGHLVAEIGDTQQDHLMVFEKGHDQASAPIRDRVEV